MHQLANLRYRTHARVRALVVASICAIALGVLAGTAAAVPPAVLSDASCYTSTLPANDDGSSSLQALPFTINFFGTNYSALYVNNNGNVTFDAPLSTFTPFDLTSTNRVIIAPFFADVDTRPSDDGGPPTGLVHWGTTTFDGRPTFCVDWTDQDLGGVGFFATNTVNRNTFQLLLVDRSNTGAGNFDIVFNYDKIEWETGQASGGDANGMGGASARAGYSNGTGDPGTSFEEPGSAVNGAFLDSNPTGLSHRRRNSTQDGRLIYQVRSGQPILVAGKISARGTVTSTPSMPVSFSAANNCDKDLSTRPSIVQWPGNKFTKTSVTSSECIDDPAVPGSGQTGSFDTQTGTATGTLQAGGAGTLEWTYVDGGPGASPSDKVQFVVRNGGGTAILTVNQQTPGALGGTPGGVWTFAP